MLPIQRKQIIAFLLVWILVFPLLPLSALGSEVEALESEMVETVVPESEVAPETPASSLPQQILGRIESILNSYGIGLDASHEDIQSAIFALSGDQINQAFADIADLDATITALSDAEQESLYCLSENGAAIAYGQFCDILETLYTPSLLADSATVNHVIITDDNDRVTDNGNNTVTVTTKSSGVYTNRTNTVYLTNGLSNAATLSFSYSFSKCATYTVNGSTPSNTSGDSGDILLQAGAAVTLTMSTGSKWNTTASVTISNISLIEVSDTVDYTFDYDDAAGKVEAGGALIANGGKVTGIDPEVGVELKATPIGTATFIGWVNTSTNALLSTSLTYKLQAGQSTTIKAYFIPEGSTAWFKAGNNRLYNDLNAASDYASTATAKTVVLMNNGILPSGEYTIDSGVTLLIPFDDAETLYTTKPALTILGVDASTGVAETLATPKHIPKPFRTMTMASGAKIIVNGALSVSGKHCASQGYNGSPIGPQGYISMDSGSSITVNSGAKLYAWGYIIGSGSVNIQSGGTVYEDFQARDWRGGSASTIMIGDNKSTYQVFPLSQYYIQNIEVPLTLHSGATEMVSMAVDISLGPLGSIQSQPVGEFISKDKGLFQLKSGTLIKDYDEEHDRLTIELSGSVTMGRLTIDVQGYMLDSPDYVLPLNNNISVFLKSGSNVLVSQHVALLPGTQMVIDEGATMTLGEVVTYSQHLIGDGETARDPVPCKIYIYDSDQWGNYTGPSSLEYYPIAYRPGGAVSRNIRVDSSIEINGTLDSGKGYFYTTAGGANIHSTNKGRFIAKAGTDTLTYQAVQYVENNEQQIRYENISITPAKLLNGDGSGYVATSNADGTYVYHPEHKRWVLDSHELTPVVTPPTCTTTGYTTHTCTCGYHYTDSETPLADHTSKAAVVEPKVDPTCLEPGSYDSVVSCEVCSAELSRTTIGIPAAGHSYENGVCKVCGCKEVSFTIAHNLALKELVQIGYWVKAESAAEIQEVGILIWKEADYFAEDQHDITSDTAVNPAMTSRQGFMMGYGEGIYAQHLDTRYYAVPYAVTADGSYVYSGIPDVYAAPTYAQQMSNQSDKVKTVVRDLLNYGTYAQLYFDIRGDNEINTTTWINDVLTEEQKQLRYDTSMLVKEITANKELPNNTLSSTWRYSTVDLLDAIQLNFHAVQSNVFDKMLYWNKESYDSADILTADNATTMLAVSDRTVNSDLCTSASISNIYPRDMDKWHYACMYSSTDNTYGPLRVDSIACYLSRMIDKYADFEGQKNTNDYLLQTCKAMLAYGDSAKTYAGQ